MMWAGLPLDSVAYLGFYLLPSGANRETGPGSPSSVGQGEGSKPSCYHVVPPVLGFITYLPSSVHLYSAPLVLLLFLVMTVTP